MDQAQPISGHYATQKHKTVLNQGYQKLEWKVEKERSITVEQTFQRSARTNKN